MIRKKQEVYVMRDYLKKGTKIKNYTVIAKLGEGASCVAYSCEDSRGRRVVVKEYYPINLAVRRENNNLECSDKDRERFQNGRQIFEETIQRQIDIRSGKTSLEKTVMNQVFDITDHFPCGGTYYCVMSEFSGRVFTRNEEMPLYDRIQTCKAIAQYVNCCHESGFLCLDIKPDNIFLPKTPDFPMFFDYDSVVRKEDAKTGHNLSYSGKWAAPEQIIPGDFTKISEATDVYALGELVFWSVFDRNSYDEEHRSFSHYPYQESPFATELRGVCRKTLDEVFLHTIQSLFRRRYQSADQLIEKLDILLNELDPRKPRLISFLPPCLSHFVGREEELQQLESMIEERHFAILQGLGGIGKSEIVKKYCAGADKYDDIVFLSYSTDLVSTLVQTNFISIIEQMEKETDSVFCKRKLDVFAELCSPRTLLVIDNLNEELENIRYGDLFNRILGLNCDLILTTRCNQETYKEYQVEVGHLETSYLVDLYRENCPFSDDQVEKVKELVQRTQNHTLLVELISRFAENAYLSPELMIERIERNGVLEIGSETVKWNQTNTSVEEHVSKLFDMSDITDDQLKLLYKICLMPPSGIGARFFCDFYEIKELSDLRSLIDRGWIKESNGEQAVLSMHSIIAQVAVSQTNKRGLIPNDFMRQLYDRVHDYKPAENLKSEDVYPLFLSISESISRLGIRDLFAANYNTLFVHVCNDYFSEDFLLNAIQVSTGIYDELYKEKYAIPREIGYFEYAKLLIKADLWSSEDADWMHSHLLSAQENMRSNIWARNWALLGYGITELSLAKYLKICIKGLNASDIEVYNPNDKSLSEKAKEMFFYQDEYPYDSIDDYFPDGRITGYSLMLDPLFYDLPFKMNRSAPKWEKLLLVPFKQQIRGESRLCKLYKESESVRLLRLKAIEDLLSNRFADAIDKLEKVIQNLNSKNPISKEAHASNLLLGRIYLLLKDFDKARICFMTCLEIEKTIKFDRWCDIETLLFSLYISTNDLKSARAVYMDIVNRRFRPDTELKILLLKYQLVAMGRQFPDDAASIYIPFLDKSFSDNYMEIYQTIGLPPENLPEDQAVICRARMIALLARYKIISQKDYIGACKDMKKAYKDISRCLGKDHPETIECMDFYIECQNMAKL